MSQLWKITLEAYIKMNILNKNFKTEPSKNLTPR